MLWSKNENIQGEFDNKCIGGCYKMCMCMTKHSNLCSCRSGALFYSSVNLFSGKLTHDDHNH